MPYLSHRRMNRAGRAGLIAAALCIAIVLTTIPRTVHAGDWGGGRGGGKLTDPAALVMACSTTDYTEVVGKALGISSSSLRQALLKGQTIQALAKMQHVDLAAVVQAVNTAVAKDVDVAVQDGLIAKSQGDTIKASPYQLPDAVGSVAQIATADASNALHTPAANATGGGDNRFYDGGLTTPIATSLALDYWGTGSLGWAGISPYHFTAVHGLAVAARAVQESCSDLVQLLRQNVPIIMVAADKDLNIQLVASNIANAYSHALDQDVAENLVSMSEASKWRQQLFSASVQLIIQQTAVAPLVES